MIPLQIRMRPPKRDSVLSTMYDHNCQTFSNGQAGKCRKHGDPNIN